MADNLVEIIPDLWLSDNHSLFNNINNYSFLDLVQINCDKELDFIGNSKKYKDTDIKQNLQKYEIIRFYKYLFSSIEFIYQNIKRNKSVIVHCLKGDQLSPSIVVAYLIKYGKMNASNAIHLIKSKSEIAFKNGIDFIFPLDKFEADLRFNKEIYSF